MRFEDGVLHDVPCKDHFPEQCNVHIFVEFTGETGGSINIRGGDATVVYMNTGRVDLKMDEIAGEMIAKTQKALGNGKFQVQPSG